MSEPPADTILPSFPSAELDRRFYAFALDRLVFWSIYALAGFAAWWFYFREGELWLGLAVIGGAIFVIWVGSSLVTGRTGTSPGKAMVGLRVVDQARGTPIGVLRALLRALVVGVSGLPTFGLGLATLAWTAVEDAGRQRRGWHDHATRSIVVDIRPAPALVEDDGSKVPRHVVNLTALRLVPQPAPDMLAPDRSPTQPRPAPGPPPAPHPTPPTDPVPVPAVQPPVPAPQPVPASSGVQPDRTRIRPAPVPAGSPFRWRVSFDTGESFVVEGLGLVGRGPEGRGGEQVRHPVPLPSPDMSLSKTHASFHLSPDGALVVTDRGSTNGSILFRRGVSKALSAGMPATLVDGDRVMFGDREMRVRREQ